MYVKASGVSLADIDESGFARMDRKKLGAIWEKQYPEDPERREEEALADLMAARLPGENVRPSVETLLHALFPKAYIVHLHPALVNGMTCGQNGRQEAERLFGGRSVWVPVVNPGYILAQTVKDIIDQHTAAGNAFPEIIFLQNHGVFVSAETPEKIEEIYTDIMSILKKQITAKPDVQEFPDGAQEETGRQGADRGTVDRWCKAVQTVLGKPECRFLVNPEIRRLVESASAFAPMASAYTPDHIVYYGHKPLFIEDSGGGAGGVAAAGGNAADRGTEPEARIKAALTEYRREYPDNPPRIVAVEGLGVVAAGDSEKRVKLMCELFTDAVKISVYTRSFGGPRFMPKDKIDFIVNWEVEKYRSSMQDK